jgi:histidinol-phosphatase
MSLPDDLELALALSDIADEITLERYQASDLVVETKPDLTPVTEADTAVERAIREQLEVARPGDSVLGEEFGVSTAPDSSRRWIIDPIDGTKNFVRGIPVWGTLLALHDRDEPLVSVVSAPALHRRWWALRGGGAFIRDGVGRDGRALRVSGVSALADAQMCFPGLEDWGDRLDALIELARACWRSRGFGDFWGYMMLAEGAVEIVCEPVVSLWDLAAPRLIVLEAGGQFTDLGGVPTAGGGDALATNGLVHAAALAVIGR